MARVKIHLRAAAVKSRSVSRLSRRPLSRRFARPVAVNIGIQRVASTRASNPRSQTLPSNGKVDRNTSRRGPNNERTDRRPTSLASFLVQQRARWTDLRWSGESAVSTDSVTQEINLLVDLIRKRFADEGEFLNVSAGSRERTK